MPDGGQKAAAAKSASDKSADKSGDRAAQAGGVQSLARALSLLKGLAGSDRGRTLTDLARHTGLAPSTAHRLLGTLQQEGFARFDQSDMRWYVGVEAFSVGISFARHRDIATMARPYMVRLMEESGETANLAVERDGVIVYLAQVECRHMMRALAGPGARVPLHSSAAGKVYLAGRLGGAPVVAGERFTPKTLASPADLERDLRGVLQRGYAVDDEEHALGLRCVAAAIRDEAGETVAALSLSGPTVRVSSDKLKPLGALVRQIADQITRAYGGRAA